MSTKIDNVFFIETQDTVYPAANAVESKEIDCPVDVNVTRGIDMDGERSIDDVVAALLELKEKGWNKVWIYDAQIFGTRKETEDEYNARLRRIEKQAAKQAKALEKERKLYERLKAKFGAEGPVP